MSQCGVRVDATGKRRTMAVDPKHRLSRLSSNSERPAFGLVLMLVLLCAHWLPAEELVPLMPLPVEFDSPPLPQNYSEAAIPAASPGFFSMALPVPVSGWTFDYRFRSLANSHTSYEFGTPDPPPDGWTPLSRLDFGLDSQWHGFQVGLQRPQWGLHFEFLVPGGGEIDGTLDDYDWMIPGADFTDLGVTRERWIKGNMLDFGGDLLLWDEPFGLPVAVWGTTGFRWQQFHLMAYDLVQCKWDNVWEIDPYRYAGDVIAFNQQYYQYYLGGQLRTDLMLGSLPVHLTLHGDWAHTEGRNVDHHLLREGDRFTIERTRGDSWRVGLTAEAQIRSWLSFGCQADYLQIRTTGSHRLLNEPLAMDWTWTNGVRAWSDQTWLTAFARITW